MNINERVARIEELLREHNLHETMCPVRQREIAQEHSEVYFQPRECNCWLSLDKE